MINISSRHVNFPPNLHTFLDLSIKLGYDDYYKDRLCCRQSRWDYFLRILVTVWYEQDDFICICNSICSRRNGGGEWMADDPKQTKAASSSSSYSIFFYGLCSLTRISTFLYPLTFRWHQSRRASLAERFSPSSSCSSTLISIFWICKHYECIKHTKFPHTKRKSSLLCF